MTRFVRQFFIILVVNHVVNDGAFDALHAQFVFEGACAAWAKLFAVLDPERGKGLIIDKVKPI